MVFNLYSTIFRFTIVSDTNFLGFSSKALTYYNRVYYIDKGIIIILFIVFCEMKQVYSLMKKYQLNVPDLSKKGNLATSL